MANSYQASYLARGFIAVIIALFDISLTPNWVSAAEVALSAPISDDAFIRALQSSKDLEAADIKVVMKVSKDVLRDVVSGESEVGLIPLHDFDAGRTDKNAPTLITTFTRPFLYDSLMELLAVQHSALGHAVLADIGRSGIFALTYWNRGLTKIVATQPIASVSSFHGLKIGVSSDGMANQVLMKLGADFSTIKIPEMSSALATGAIEATVVKPEETAFSFWSKLSETKTPVYITSFEPMVGVLALSPKYWQTLKETEKRAWKRAADDATIQSNGLTEKIADAGERIYKFNYVTPTRELKLVSFEGQVARGSYDLNAIEREKTFLKEAADQRAKKKSN